jgi:hypothetical protein
MRRVKCEEPTSAKGRPFRKLQLSLRTGTHLASKEVSIAHMIPTSRAAVKRNLEVGCHYERD